MTLSCDDSEKGINKMYVHYLHSFFSFILLRWKPIVVENQYNTLNTVNPRIYKLN